MCLELGEELGRALKGELALALALPKDHAAAASLGALVRVAGAVLETGPLVAGMAAPRPTNKMCSESTIPAIG
ncbi:hypothetical protein GCM10023334_041720 [Nonomuraea thailandensis]